MADNKKYYYLRLKDNFFDSDEILVLESMPDGILFSNILLKLYLRSLKNNGKLMLNDRIPYNSIMLSQITRHPVAVVEKAISAFIALGLVEVLDNGAIYMLDIQSFIGESSTEADRKRQYRSHIEAEKSKLLGTNVQTNVGQMSEKNPPEIEIKKEIDTDKEIDIDVVNHSTKNLTPKVVKHKYGQYLNVLLTDEEMEKLMTEFPFDWQERVERLSEYIACHGKKYKNHLAVIRSWAKKDVGRRPTVAQKSVVKNDVEASVNAILAEMGLDYGE